MTADATPHPARWLPVDDPHRLRLHGEAHARPSAHIRMPALVLYVAVRHDGVERAAQWQHLRRHAAAAAA